MAKLFGAAVTSIVPVQSLTQKRYGNNAVVTLARQKISAKQLRQAKKAKLILCHGSGQFLRLPEEFTRNSKLVFVVFDFPSALESLPKLKMLDHPKQGAPNILDYTFTNNEFNYADLFAAVDHAYKSTLRARKINVLNKMIFNRANGGLYEQVLNIQFSTNDMESRKKVKQSVFDYFMTHNNVAKFQTALQKSVDLNEYRRKSITKLVDFCKGKKGTNLLQAFKHIRKHKKINFTKAALKHKTDKTDLKYLVKQETSK